MSTRLERARKALMAAGPLTIDPQDMPKLADAIWHLIHHLEESQSSVAPPELQMDHLGRLKVQPHQHWVKFATQSPVPTTLPFTEQPAEMPQSEHTSQESEPANQEFPASSEARTTQLTQGTDTTGRTNGRWGRGRQWAEAAIQATPVQPSKTPEPTSFMSPADPTTGRSASIGEALVGFDSILYWLNAMDDLDKSGWESRNYQHARENMRRICLAYIDSLSSPSPVAEQREEGND